MLSAALGSLCVPKIPSYRVLDEDEEELAARKRCSSAGVSDLMPLPSKRKSRLQAKRIEEAAASQGLRSYGPKTYKPGLPKSGYIKPPWIQEQRTVEESDEEITAAKFEKIVKDRRKSQRISQLGANLCELGDTINVQEATSSEDDGDDLTSDDYDDDDGEADAPANSGSWSFLGGSKGKGGTLASIFNATLSLAYGGGARIKWRRNSRSAPASYAGSKEDIADSDGRPVSSDKKKRKKHWLKKH